MLTSTCHLVTGGAETAETTNECTLRGPGLLVGRREDGVEGVSCGKWGDRGTMPGRGL